MNSEITMFGWEYGIKVIQLFNTMFSLRLVGREIKSNLSEDDIYTIAHDEFMIIADIIETAIPLITNEDTNDTKWYDEYHDQVVSDFCLELNTKM